VPQSGGIGNRSREESTMRIAVVVLLALAVALGAAGGSSALAGNPKGGTQVTWQR
jgi:hypothetical protein